MGGDRVGLAVAGEVAGGDEEGAVVGGGYRLARGERAAAVAAEETERPGAGVGDEHVGVAVGVEVGDGERVRGGAAGERRARGGGEAALAVAEQQGEVVVVLVHGEHVEAAVIVDVDQREAVRVGTLARRPCRDRRARRDGERAGSVAEQERNGVAVVAGGDRVELAVAVHVAQRDLVRRLGQRDGRARRRRERRAVAREHHVQRPPARDEQVVAPVAVDVRGGEVARLNLK